MHVCRNHVFGQSYANGYDYIFLNLPPLDDGEGCHRELLLILRPKSIEYEYRKFTALSCSPKAQVYFVFVNFWLGLPSPACIDSSIPLHLK